MKFRTLQQRSYQRSQTTGYTQEKDFGDIPNKEGHFDSDHIFIFRLNPQNKITDIRISWDHSDLKKQMG